jgi:hypothetical protein
VNNQTEPYGERFINQDEIAQQQYNATPYVLACQQPDLIPAIETDSFLRKTKPYAHKT